MADALRSNTTARHSAIAVLTILLVIKYVVPISFAGSIAAPTHDNLDSEVVYSIVAGRFLGGDWAAFDVFLGGTLDWRAFPRTLQPISFIYAMAPPQWAYGATEALLIIFAFFGMRKLLRTLSFHESTLVCACFAFGLSYSSYGAGMALAPLVLSLLISTEIPRRRDLLLVFFVGLNSTFVLHGLFLPAVAIALSVMFRRKIDIRRFAVILGVYVAASLLTSVGLVMLVVEGIPSHREDWAQLPSASPLVAILTSSLENILMMGSASSAFLVPVIYSTFALAAAVLARSGLGRSAAVLVGFVFVSMLLREAEPFISTLSGGMLGSIQWHRFILFAPLLALVLASAVMTFTHKSRVLRGTLIVYLAFAELAGMGIRSSALVDAVPVAKVEQVRALLRADQQQAAIGEAIRAIARIHPGDLLAGMETWSSHFQNQEYSCARDALLSSQDFNRAVSLGTDPLIAAAHEIPVIDGYHNLYPLDYKRAFRSVIADTLANDSFAAEYFDEWGSRVYTTFGFGGDLNPNWIAATALGATHVISTRILELEEIADCNGLKVYQI